MCRKGAARKLQGLCISVIWIKEHRSYLSISWQDVSSCLQVFNRLAVLTQALQQRAPTLSIAKLAAGLCGQ
jgi:hypothetical protein